MQAPPTKLNVDAKEFHPAVVGQNVVSSLDGTDDTIASDSVPEFSTQDNIEADPEAIAALKGMQTLDSDPTSDPALPVDKDPMVDEDFCRLCARPLTPDATKKEAESETYSHHCNTKEHTRNAEEYEYFSKEEIDYYRPREKALLVLLSEGDALYKVLKHKELQEMIEKLEKKLKDSNAELHAIRDSAKWSEGVMLVQNELSGKLDMLHMKLERTLENYRKEKLDLEKEREQEALKSDIEEDGEDDDESEEEEIEQANYKMKKHKKTKKTKNKRGKKK